MDERAEIWIARDPETNAESKPVSLRKLRKGMHIARLKPTTLVTRMGSTEWVTLERLLADAALLAARAATPPPPEVIAPPPPEVMEALTQVEAGATVIVEDAPSPAEPEQAPEATQSTPPPPPVALRGAKPDDSSALTAQWFEEPPPEPGDDEPIFATQTSVLDVRFERVGSVKLVRTTYVLLLAFLAGAVLVSVIRAFVVMASGDGAQIATAIMMVPVVVLACAVVGGIGRLLLELLLTTSRIADKLAALSRAQGLRS